MASNFRLGAAVFFLIKLLMAVEARSFYINYTTVTGYFLQDDPSTNPSTFDFTATNFGLIPRTYDTDADYDPNNRKTQWQRFERQVHHLQDHAPRHVNYKVLYLGRHGEGYHNTAETYYGTPAWDCYWSKLEGNGTVTWADAHLTPNGIQQAQTAKAFWASQITNQKIRTPQRFYVSPLYRALSTASTTFSGLDLRDPFNPDIKELLRETIGIHTSDRRSSKSAIRAAFPGYRFEPGFAENDPLWTPDLRESDSAQTARLKKLLDDLFQHDDHTFLSFTSHSGSIAAILRAIGHRPFPLSTGAVIPVLVRFEKVYEPAPETSIDPSTPAPACTTNPTAFPAT